MFVPLNRYPDDPNKPRPGVLERWYSALVERVNYLLTGTQSGVGSPEGLVTAPQGSLYRRTDGGAVTSLYVKTTGGVAPATLTNTGWVAK